MKKAIALCAVLGALVVPIGATSALAVGDTAKSVRVPRVSGLRLDTAEIRLLGARLRYKEHGGGVFGIVIRHDWQVCLQVPRAGAHVPSQTRVQLYVSRPGQC